MPVVSIEFGILEFPFSILHTLRCKSYIVCILAAEMTGDSGVNTRHAARILSHAHMCRSSVASRRKPYSSSIYIHDVAR